LLDYANPSRAAITESAILSRTKAAYAQAIYNFSPTFRVTGGARYTWDYRRIDSRNRIDLAAAVPPLPAGGTSRCNLLAPALGGPVFPNCSYIASVNNSRFTWLLSTDWRPIRDVMLYATVSTGYRSGAFNAPGFSGPIGTVAENNAAFTPYLPESLTNYEAGIKSDLLGRHLRINASGFYQTYRNVQVRARIPVTGIAAPLQTISNAAAATLYGAELEVTAVPIPGLTLNGTASYVHAQYDSYIDRTSTGVAVDRTSQPFPIPKWRFSVGASYEIPVSNGSIRLNANYAYTGTTIFVPNLVIDNPRVVSAVTQRGYGLLSGRIAWNIDSLNLELAVFGKNLTDRRYAANMYDVGFYTGVIPGDPRTFGVSLRKTF
jgi:iron complex outermembrane receptor protein